MSKLLFQIGLLAIIYSFLGWLAFSSNNVFHITGAELAFTCGVGLFLMLPELVYQFRQFFSSKSKLED